MFILTWDSETKLENRAEFDDKEVAHEAFYKLHRMRDVVTACLEDQDGRQLDYFGK